MQKQIIKVVEFDEERVSIPSGLYRPDPKGRAVWLQRLCAWVLQKLGTPHVNYADVKHRVHVLDGDHIMDKVVTSNEAAWLFHRREPTHLFIGPEQWQELTGYVMDQGRPYDMDICYQNGQRMFRNLKVRIVPWMDGVLVF